MVNGQLDISGPLDNAWQLSKVLPDSELVVISDAGHGASGTALDAIVAATNRFAP
jgi:proline iminopeptidase